MAAKVPQMSKNERLVLGSDLLKDEPALYNNGRAYARRMQDLYAGKLPNWNFGDRVLRSDHADLLAEFGSNGQNVGRVNTAWLVNMAERHIGQNDKLAIAAIRELRETLHYDKGHTAHDADDEQKEVKDKGDQEWVKKLQIPKP